MRLEAAMKKLGFFSNGRRLFVPDMIGDCDDECVLKSDMIATD